MGVRGRGAGVLDQSGRGRCLADSAAYAASMAWSSASASASRRPTQRRALGEYWVRGRRRPANEEVVDDAQGQLRLAVLGEGCRWISDRKKSSLLLPVVHHGERAREQGEGSNAMEEWGEAAPATHRGAEQGSSSAGGAEREGSGAQGRRVRLRGRRPGTAGCVGNSQRGFL